tara:strand:+ start:72 stop:248 length:177 start_codon:yes stop_codon:yes gene_type:complete
MMDTKNEKENLSPMERLNLTFGRLNNEQKKNEEKPQDSEKSDTRNKPNDREYSRKKDR